MRLFGKNWLLRAPLTSLFIVLTAFRVLGQEVAVVAPLEGNSAIVGKQMSHGSAAYSTEIEVLNDNCNALSGQMAAEAALAGGAEIIIGLPCVEALDAAALVVQAHESEAIIIALGVEVPDITNREKRSDWPVFRLAANGTQEAKTIAQYIGQNWRSFEFAMIDDGTLYGRQFVEDVRFLLEQDNLKPVFIDNYRPLLENQSGMLRRLQRSGATHVLIGGDAYDASIMGRGAEALGIRLNFAGGSAFLAPPADGRLPDGTVFTARDAISTSVGGVELSDYAATTYVALQIADQARKYAADKGVSLNLAMRVLRFETVLGPISFGNDGENTWQWYTMYEVENGSARPLMSSLQQ